MFSETHEYACDENWPEIICVMKRLYSDFIVVEILQSGQVLHPSTSSISEEVKKSDQFEQQEMPVPVIPPEFEDKLDDIGKLEKLADGTCAECIIDLKNYSKEVRKKLYQFISNSYHDKLLTECVNGVLKVIRSNDKTMSERNNRKRKCWPSERNGDYLHFTLAKINLDTHAALNSIARKLRLKQSVFSVSGTKDRRAITVQRVSAYRVEKSRLQNFNIKGIYLSDFQYSDNKLQLGDSCGNHFSIILRDIDPTISEIDLARRIEKWKTHGFLNYFGSQRFGTCGVNTAEIGRLILLEEWEQAVRMLLSPRNDINAQIGKCLECFKELNDAKEAIKLLSFVHDNSVQIECQLLTFLASNPNCFKAALISLPRNVRTMYLHSYQSSVFNKIISRRRKIFGLQVLSGDLDKDGNILNKETASITQVCLPLPSLALKLPENQVGKWYKEIAEQDRITLQSFEKLERHFSLGSIYRPFVIKPTNISWELLKYSQTAEELQHCEFIKCKKLPPAVEQNPKLENSAKNIYQALKIEFDLPPGTYATIALQELMRIDFSKQSQKELESKLLNIEWSNEKQIP